VNKVESKTDLVANIIECINEDTQFELAWETLRKVPKPVLNYINNLHVKCYDLERANIKLQLLVKENEV
jgi:hypothetical protein